MHKLDVPVTTFHGKRYLSMADLERLYPWRAINWRRWIEAGQIAGVERCYGLLYIPFEEAERIVKAKHGSTGHLLAINKLYVRNADAVTV